jgi:hypothetical protein
MPFSTIGNNGRKRLLDLIKSNKFTFIMNGSHSDGTVAEAILIPSSVSESLLKGPNVSTFSISRSTIGSNDFTGFVQLIRSNNCLESAIPGLSLLLIFHAFGHESLLLSLLASMYSRINESESSCNSKSIQSGIPISREYLHVDMTIGYCASKFSFYSTAELCCLDRNLLYTLLSASLLRLENEDVLLPR